jgi:hypothetical protein
VVHLVEADPVQLGLKDNLGNLDHEGFLEMMAPQGVLGAVESKV